MNEKVLALTLENIIVRLEGLEKANITLQKRIDTLEKKDAFNIENYGQENQNVTDELLTLPQVRKLLNCSRNSVLKFVREGYLIVKRLPCRSVRYSRLQVLKLIREL